MPARGDILNQEIKSVYVDMIHIYATDEDDNVLYKLTEDTAVVRGKNYFQRTGSGTAADPYVFTVYSPASDADPSSLGLYQEQGAYFNGSSSFITFRGKQYLPAAFSVTEPDRTSVNEETGSLTVAGVPSEYVEMVQEATAYIHMECSLIKYDEIPDGLYILEPVTYDVKSISMSSANASMTISLKGGGLLGYYISKDTYGTTNFPGLNC